MWAGVALIGIASLVFFVVRYGRLLVQDLREFGRSIED
jgi:hypothetical protein